MKTNKASNEKNTARRIIGFRVVENECIWMKAGIVSLRSCDNAYDCNSCPFDKAMTRAMGLGDDIGMLKHEPEWVEYLKKRYQGALRPCRHALTGRIDAPKICSLNYECYHCAFDQMLDATDLDQDIEAPRYQLVSGYQLADGYYYHRGHSWARFEHGGRVTVGFDDFLVKLLGPLHSLKLPELGKALVQNRVGWMLGRDKYQASVLAPVSGKVLAVNQKALQHPEITHEDPYHAGWLLILEADMPRRNRRGLAYGKESIKWMEMEGQKLLRLIGPEYENLAATGGILVGDVFGVFPQIGWDVLTREFLHTETTS